MFRSSIKRQILIQRDNTLALKFRKSFIPDPFFYKGININTKKSDFSITKEHDHLPLSNQKLHYLLQTLSLYSNKETQPKKTINNFLITS